MNAVVVRARFDSKTLESTDPYEVRKGDFGVLKWKAHRRHPRFFEPHVVWDRDPKRKVRKVIVSSIAIIGFQVSTSRVLLLPSPR